LDQISADKTKLSERLARLDTDRAMIATQLTNLETAERVLTRVSKAPPGRKPSSDGKMCPFPRRSAYLRDCYYTYFSNAGIAAAADFPVYQAERRLD
jgi:hypothetical protein